jgi:hypothetical protein
VFFLPAFPIYQLKYVDLHAMLADCCKSKCAMYVLPCVLGKCRSYVQQCSHICPHFSTVGLPEVSLVGSPVFSLVGSSVDSPAWLTIWNSHELSMMVHESVVLLVVLLALWLVRPWVIMSAFLLVLQCIKQNQGHKGQKLYRWWTKHFFTIATFRSTVNKTD